MRFAPGPIGDVTREDAVALTILAALAVALFTTSLSFIPVSGDDHHQLAAALAMENPLPVFYGTFGSDHPYYRPLHAFFLWLGAQAFDIRWWPNQLLSLMLHFLNTGLLYFLLGSDDRERRRMAFLAAALYLASVHTVETAVWVAARTDLMVAACLLAYLLHAKRRRAVGLDPEVGVVATLSVIGLLSKESGVLVPALAACGAIRLSRLRESRWPMVVAAASILVAYAAFRVAIFGTFAADTHYEQRPIILFGGRDLTELPVAQRVAGYGETAVKHGLALVLPVFDNQGLVHSPGKLAQRAPLWLLTPILVILTWRRPLSGLQLQGLLVIALSSLVHSSFFAVYLLYLGQIGFCLFLGDSRPRCRRGVEVLGGALLIVHLSFAARYQSERLVGERTELERWVHQGVPASADSELAEPLLRRYSRPIARVESQKVDR